MTDFVIETDQLTKSFKGQPALRGLELRVPKGSIYGFQWAAMAFSLGLGAILFFAALKVAQAREY
ncbi:MAG: hypothetical protein ACLPWF_07875 [Bryobacteraceae bacterium]